MLRNKYVRIGVRIGIALLMIVTLTLGLHWSGRKAKSLIAKANAYANDVYARMVRIQKFHKELESTVAGTRNTILLTALNENRIRQIVAAKDPMSTVINFDKAEVSMRKSAINLVHEFLDAQGEYAEFVGTNELASFLGSAEPFLKEYSDLHYQKITRVGDEMIFVLRRRPQHITGYPTHFDNELKQEVTINFAGGILSKGKSLKSYNIRNSVSGESILTKSYGEDRIGIKRQGCRSFYRFGAQYSQKISIDSAKLGCGEFYITLSDNTDAVSDPIFFNVRSSSENDDLPEVVVMFPEFTWHAYNQEGGGSLYYLTLPVEISFPKLHNIGVHKLLTTKLRLTDDGLYSVSLKRPLYFSEERYLQGEYLRSAASTLVFLRELVRANIRYRTISSLSLHRKPELLNKANLLILTGHDEYWTSEMRDSLEGFVRNGGRIANFTGNVCWGKLNAIESELFVSRRNYAGAPAEFDSTGLWSSKKIGRPPEEIFGISYAYAGYPVQEFMNESQARAKGIDQQLYQESGNIVIKQPEHPVFAGTGLRRGQQWGGKVNILAVELDGVPVDAGGNIQDDFKDRFPANLNILANAFAYNANAIYVNGRRYYGLTEVGLFTECVPFEGGGHVVSFGSIGFTFGLMHKDPVASKIFLNTVEYLLKLNLAGNQQN